MAVSLPPGLDYQQRVLSPTASSFVSREDLQCNWQDLPKFDVEPVELEIVAKKSSQDVTEENIATTKQPLNLSSLFMHQVGRKINQYKSLMGKSSSKKSLTNVASFVSMASATTARDPGPSISRQASTKRKQDQYQVQGRIDINHFVFIILQNLREKLNRKSFEIRSQSLFYQPKF